MSAQHTQRRKLSSLRPNSSNTTTFTHSLEEVEQLSNDLSVRGQLAPLRIRPDGEILSGERRWRAMKALGWEECDVVVVDAPAVVPQVEIFLDATSQRDLRPSERVNLYRLGDAQREELGRFGPAEGDFRDWLAKLVGFSSGRTARKALRVFDSGFEEIMREVDEGRLSIDAADRRVASSATDPHQKEQLDAPASSERPPALSGMSSGLPWEPAWGSPAQPGEAVNDEFESGAVEEDDCEADEVGEPSAGEDDVSQGPATSIDNLLATLEQLTPYDLMGVRSAVAELHFRPLTDWLETLQDPDGDQMRIALAIAHLDAAQSMLADASGSVFELGWDTSEQTKAARAIDWVKAAAQAMFGTAPCDCEEGCADCGNLAVTGHKLARRGGV